MTVLNFKPVTVETEPNEISAAHFLVSENAGRIRWVRERGRWLVFDGTVWRDGDCHVQRLIQGYCGTLAVDTKKASWGSWRAVAAVDRLMRGHEEINASISAFDADPWLLGTPAGVVDLRTGELRPATPEDMITRTTAVAPDCDRRPERWIRFLRDVTCGDGELADWLQRVCGYALTGSVREQCFWFLYGPGGNGKSVFVGTLAGILGSYHKTAADNVFVRQKYEDHPAGLADLVGARLVTATEIGRGQEWHVQRLKAVTGGDMIKARFMRQDFFEFKPQFKLIISGNFKPALDAVDPAIIRRMRVVPFRARFPEPDPELPERLREEWPAILGWMIRGCLKWRERGLAPPEAVRAETEEYLSEQDLIGRFIDECCELDAPGTPPGTGFRCLSSKLYAAWAEWCRNQGENPGTNKSFSAEPTKRGFRKTRTRFGIEFWGIAIRQDGGAFRDGDAR